MKARDLSILCPDIYHIYLGGGMVLDDFTSECTATNQRSMQFTHENPRKLDKRDWPGARNKNISLDDKFVTIQTATVGLDVTPTVDDLFNLITGVLTWHVELINGP